MYRLQIMVKRVLTPAEGQAKLAEINAKVSEQVNQGMSWGRVAVEGTLKENPFPDWLMNALRAGIPGLQLDELNFIFFREYDTTDEARYYENWIRGPLLDWAKSNPNWLIAMNQLDVQVMDASATEIGEHDLRDF